MPSSPPAMTASWKARLGSFWSRRFPASVLAGVAFIGGALFAFLFAYCVYLLRSAPAEQRAVLSSEAGQTPGAGSADANQTADGRSFADRLTYELSRTPRDKRAQKSAAQDGAKDAPRASKAASAEAAAVAAQDAAARISNARPIYATPPDPRDTTRAIERETQRSYAEPPSAQADRGIARAPRIIEGRELAIAPRSGSSKGAGKQPALVSPNPAQTSGPLAGSVGAGQLDVESRMVATRDWLSSAAPTTHTIQILGSPNDEQLRSDLNALSRVLDPDRIFLFRTRAQGRPSTTVLYGAYPDRKAAFAALDKLPAGIALNRPVLRTVKGIRAEIMQNKDEP